MCMYVCIYIFAKTFHQFCKKEISSISILGNVLNYQMQIYICIYNCVCFKMYVYTLELIVHTPCLPICVIMDLAIVRVGCLLLPWIPDGWVFFWKLLCYSAPIHEWIIMPLGNLFVDWIAGWCSNLAAFEMSSPQHQQMSLMPIKQAWRMMRMDTLYIGAGTYYKNDVLTIS